MCFRQASKFPALVTNPCPLENESTSATDPYNKFCGRFEGLGQLVKQADISLITETVEGELESYNTT